MKLKRALARLAPVALAAAAASLLTASPASAISWDWGPYYDSSKGVKVYFEEKGDRLKVCDIKSDGKWVMAWVDVQGGKSIYLADTKNDGKCRYSKASDSSYYNLPEKKWIEITPCTSTGNMCDTTGKTRSFYNDH
ncbi:hypothetical protein [Streptomyces sp. NPDC048172]|uniref:hypothetical protein n=1 Tax=Streptomyces sp. NPDC048172 TaxID=3365505 RepID=UPI003724B5BC